MNGLTSSRKWSRPKCERSHVKLNIIPACSISCLRKIGANRSGSRIPVDCATFDLLHRSIRDTRLILSAFVRLPKSVSRHLHINAALGQDRYDRYNPASTLLIVFRTLVLKVGRFLAVLPMICILASQILILSAFLVSSDLMARPFIPGQPSNPGQPGQEFIPGSIFAVPIFPVFPPTLWLPFSTANSCWVPRLHREVRQWRFGPVALFPV